MREEYKQKKKELRIKLERDAQEVLHSEYRKIMGENYGSLEELWKAFDKIEQTFFSKINLPNKGDILHAFEKDKLRLMSDRVVKNVRTQGEMMAQSKESEIATLKEIIVSNNSVNNVENEG
jgi:hypothetical protein